MHRAVKLHVGAKDGRTLDLPGPDTYLGHDKVSGNDSLSMPAQTAFGLPILVGGAEMVIPWTDIAKVEVTGAPPEGATVSYQDGRQEAVQIEDGTLEASEALTIHLPDVARIDVILSAPGQGARSWKAWMIPRSTRPQ